jgi:hypothetical protein
MDLVRLMSSTHLHIFPALLVSAGLLVTGIFTKMQIKTWLTMIWFVYSVYQPPKAHEHICNERLISELDNANSSQPDMWRHQWFQEVYNSSRNCINATDSAYIGWWRCDFVTHLQVQWIILAVVVGSNSYLYFRHFANAVKNDMVKMKQLDAGKVKVLRPRLDWAPVPVPSWQSTRWTDVNWPRLVIWSLGVLVLVWCLMQWLCHNFWLNMFFAVAMVLAIIFIALLFEQHNHKNHGSDNGSPSVFSFLYAQLARHVLLKTHLIRSSPVDVSVMEVVWGRGSEAWNDTFVQKRKDVVLKVTKICVLASICLIVVPFKRLDFSWLTCTMLWDFYNYLKGKLELMKMQRELQRSGELPTKQVLFRPNFTKPLVVVDFASEQS